MSQAETIPKLSDVSFDELRNWVVQGMDDMEKALLSKESNNETLDLIIREHQANTFLADADVPVVVTSILKRFSKNSLSGEISKFIYMGSRDFYGKGQNASSHSALMLRLTEDMKVDDKDAEGQSKRATMETNIFNQPTPNKRVSDLWEPGYSYDCSITEKLDKNSKIDAETGQVKIYYNIKNYRLVENSKELLAKAILNINSGHQYFAQFKNGVDAELAKMLQPQMQYKPVTMEYVVQDISGIQVSERVLRGETYEWATAENAPLHPVVKANRQNKPQIVFNINGEIKVNDALTVVIYGSFNAADFAQYFVSSPSIQKLFDTPAFLTENPQNQADVLGIACRGKTFRIVGDMQNIDFAAEGDKAFINISGIALVEVPPAN